jgi:hypothetical protein
MVASLASCAKSLFAVFRTSPTFDLAVITDSPNSLIKSSGLQEVN